MIPELKATKRGPATGGAKKKKTVADKKAADAPPPVQPRTLEMGPNRATTSRQYRILEVIQQNPGLTAAEIAERVRCSESSFFRDLRYLQIDLGLPIEGSRKKGGYTLTKPVLGFASMYITSSELLSLLLARRSAERTRHVALAKPLKGAIEKLKGIMTEEIAQLGDRLDKLISFRSGTVEVLVDAEVAITVWDALVESEEIELMYWSLKTAGHEPRVLQPLHLLEMDSVWYLFAHDPQGTDPKPHTYLLSRMRDVRRTGRTFKQPSDFDVDDLLAHSIGIYGGDEPQRVHLRLYEKAVRWFGERRFHDTQQFTSQPDGTAELTMEVAINPELERLVLSWGSQAEVLAPASLRECISKVSVR
jgi:predicted DNA-binding transcriptional regulator YafY